MISSAPPEVQSQVQVTSAYRSPQTQAGILSDSLAKRHGPDAVAKWQGYVDSNNGDVVAAGQQARPWLKKIGETQWVAPPGGSNHQKGDAVDLKYLDPAATKWFHDNAPQYGLNFPLSNEDWHIEPAGLRDGTTSTANTAIAQNDVPVQTAAQSGASATPTDAPTSVPTQVASNAAPAATPAVAAAPAAADAPKKGLFGLPAIPTIIPDKVMGIDTKKGINAMGAISTAMQKQADTNNAASQQAVQAGQQRRVSAQPIQIAQVGGTPLMGNSVPAQTAGMSPQDLDLLKKKLLMSRAGGLGGLGGFGGA